MALLNNTTTMQTASAFLNGAVPSSEVLRSHGDECCATLHLNSHAAVFRYMFYVPQAAPSGTPLAPSAKSVAGHVGVASLILSTP